MKNITRLIRSQSSGNSGDSGSSGSSGEYARQYRPSSSATPGGEDAGGMSERTTGARVALSSRLVSDGAAVKYEIDGSVLTIGQPLVSYLA